MEVEINALLLGEFPFRWCMVEVCPPPYLSGLVHLALELNSLLSGVGQRVVPVSRGFGSLAVEINALFSGEFLSSN